MPTNIAGLFETPVDPFEEQNRGFQQNLMRSTTPQQFLATVGSNFGAQLGQGAKSLFGFKTPEQEKADDIKEIQKIAQQQPDEVGYYKTLIEGLRAKGYLKEAMALSERLKAAQQEKAKEAFSKTISERGSSLTNDDLIKELAKVDPLAAASMLAANEKDKPEVLKLLKRLKEYSEGSYGHKAIKARLEKLSEADKTKGSTLGTLMSEREALLTSGVPLDDPRVQAYNAAVKKESEGIAKDPTVGTAAELISWSKYQKPFSDLSPQEKAKVAEEANKKKGLSEALADLSAVLVKGFTKEVGEGTGKESTPVAIQDLENTISSLYRAKEMLDDPDGIYSGGYADAKMTWTKYTPFGNQKKLENTEAYLAHVRTTVIPMLKAFGGNDSNQELTFLEEMLGGKVKMELKSLKEIVNSAITKMERKIERTQKAAGSAAAGKLPSVDVTTQKFGDVPKSLKVGEERIIGGVKIKRVE